MLAYRTFKQVKIASVISWGGGVGEGNEETGYLLKGSMLLGAYTKLIMNLGM